MTGTRYFTPPRPRLFAHRGSAGAWPENTLPSFLAALAAGVVYLELDVWVTRDGVAVIHHDETALRTCGVDARICDLTLSELKKLDAGHGFNPDGGPEYPFRGRKIAVPTLTELFEVAPGALFNIEIKQGNPPVEDLIVDTVVQTGMEARVLLAAEQDEVMQRIRKGCGDIPTSLSFGELQDFYDWVGAGCRDPYAPPGKALQIPQTFGPLELVTQESVQAAHAAGLEMHVWTVNDRADMQRLFKLGVDGLMSDHPEVLIEEARQFK